MKEKIIFMLFALLAVGAVIAIPALRGQSQNISGSAAQQRDDESYGPIADYAASEPIDPKERARRQAKQSRYSGRHIKEDPRVEEIHLISEGGAIPAIPVALSTVVLVGEVTDTRAYMSSDKRGIYSEFQILVDEVLEPENQVSLDHGETVIVEREGGRVRFESGHIVRYSVDRQGMPRKGRRYLLFLRRNDKADNLYIVTGYELQGGKVYPLDGVDVAQGASQLSQFAVYESADETALLDAVRKAITQFSQTSPQERRQQ